MQERELENNNYTNRFTTLKHATHTNVEWSQWISEVATTILHSSTILNGYQSWTISHVAESNLHRQESNLIHKVGFHSPNVRHRIVYEIKQLSRSVLQEISTHILNAYGRSIYNSHLKITTQHIIYQQCISLNALQILQEKIGFTSKISQSIKKVRSLQWFLLSFADSSNMDTFPSKATGQLHPSHILSSRRSQHSTQHRGMQLPKGSTINAVTCLHAQHSRVMWGSLQLPKGSTINA